MIMPYKKFFVPLTLAALLLSSAAIASPNVQFYNDNQSIGSYDIIQFQIKWENGGYSYYTTSQISSDPTHNYTTWSWPSITSFYYIYIRDVTTNSDFKSCGSGYGYQYLPTKVVGYYDGKSYHCNMLLN
jgi:hypothetical protein